MHTIGGTCDSQENTAGNLSKLGTKTSRWRVQLNLLRRGHGQSRYLPQSLRISHLIKTHVIELYLLGRGLQIKSEYSVGGVQRSLKIHAGIPLLLSRSSRRRERAQWGLHLPVVEQNHVEVELNHSSVAQLQRHMLETKSCVTSLMVA